MYITTDTAVHSVSSGTEMAKCLAVLLCLAAGVSAGRRSRQYPNINVQPQSYNAFRPAPSLTVEPEPGNYDFQYNVDAPDYGTRFGHQEQRQGDVARGRYYVLLPDGRTQTVEYTADQDGYHPTISYQDGYHPTISYQDGYHPTISYQGGGYGLGAEGGGQYYGQGSGFSQQRF